MDFTMTKVVSIFSVLILLLLTRQSCSADDNDRQRSAESDVKQASESGSSISIDKTNKPAKRKAADRIMIIGPDGERREYKTDPGSIGLSTADGDSKDSTDESDSSAESRRNKGPDAQEFEERLVIGVQCVEADDLIRHHLKLSDCGLVVVNVREGTPAAESGLQRFDVLVRVADTELKSRQELIEAVLSSNGHPLKLAVVRAGEPLTIAVTPRKMPVPVIMAPVMVGDDTKDLSNSGIEVQPGQVFPGLLFEGKLPNDDAEMQAMLQQLRELAEQTTADSGQGGGIVLPRRDKQLSPTEQEIQQTIKNLQRQIESLQAQLKSLQDNPPGDSNADDPRE
jgi:hypothetical protein